MQLVHWFEEVSFLLLLIEWPNLRLHPVSVHFTLRDIIGRKKSLAATACQSKSATKEDKMRLSFWRSGRGCEPFMWVRIRAIGPHWAFFFSLKIRLKTKSSRLLSLSPRKYINEVRQDNETSSPKEIRSIAYSHPSKPFSDTKTKINKCYCNMWIKNKSVFVPKKTS